MVGLMKSNGCMALLNIMHINLQQCHNQCHWVDINFIYSPFIYRKNLMWKTSGNPFLGHLGEWVFHIFPILHLIMEDAPWYLLRFLWIMLQYLLLALCNTYCWALCDKKWTLICIDKFRLRQENVSSSIYILKISKKNTKATC